MALGSVRGFRLKFCVMVIRDKGSSAWPRAFPPHTAFLSRKARDSHLSSSTLLQKVPGHTSLGCEILHCHVALQSEMFLYRCVLGDKVITKFTSLGSEAMVSMSLDSMSCGICVTFLSHVSLRIFHVDCTLLVSVGQDSVCQCVHLASPRHSWWAMLSTGQYAAHCAPLVAVSRFLLTLSVCGGWAQGHACHSGRHAWGELFLSFHYGSWGLNLGHRLWWQALTH